ncbi:MAG: hypothetical protein HOD92_03540 [Deltaproteobacteria bacterium]|jgi:A/G-specific adenine glycosylase|nr:hypothetical protein [Deltaproteobacteria bacterium]
MIEYESKRIAFKWLQKQSLNDIQNKLIRWGKDNYATFPWRTTNNHFHALIAELMLQRTRAEQVVPIYNKFTNIVPTFSTRFEHKIMRDLLLPLGLTRRIEYIILLIDKIACKKSVPDGYDKLVSLPGIGDYTASAFLSFHLDQRFPIIDSNAVRLWCRLSGVSYTGNTRRIKWFKELVNDITPYKNVKEFNYAVIDLSRLICQRKPICHPCPLKKYCTFSKIQKE